MSAAALAHTDWQELDLPAGTTSASGRSPRTTQSENGGLAYARPVLEPVKDTVSAGQEGRTVQPPVVIYPRYLAPRQHFIPLARREGVVVDVRDDEFDARLVDLDGDDDDLGATFAKDELSPDDIVLLRVGAVFYWTVGYLDNEVRRRTRMTDLRFRRLPAEEPTALEEARVKADQILRDLGLR